MDWKMTVLRVATSRHVRNKKRCWKKKKCFHCKLFVLWCNINGHNLNTTLFSISTCSSTSVHKYELHDILLLSWLLYIGLCKQIALVRNTRRLFFTLGVKCFLLGHHNRRPDQSKQLTLSTFRSVNRLQVLLTFWFSLTHQFPITHPLPPLPTLLYLRKFLSFTAPV